MTTYTQNMRIPYLDQNVAQPEVPENTAKDIIDSMLTNVSVTNAVADVDITIPHNDDATNATSWQSLMFNITDTNVLLTAPRNVNFPTYPRTYIFMNNTLQSLTFKTNSGAGFLLGAGSNAYAYSDGTSIYKLEFAPTGSTWLSLSDTPGSFDTVGNISRVNATSDGLEWYNLQSDLNLKANTSGATLTGYGEVSNDLGSISGAIDIDISSGNVVTATIVGATTFTFTTTQPNTSFSLLVVDATTNITWPTIKWEGGVEPTWSVTGEDLITLKKIGASWYGSALIGVA